MPAEALDEAAAEVAVELGVDIFNVHIAGGMEMMRDAAEATKSRAAELGVEKPLILGVTVLTSIDESMFQRILNSSVSLQDQIVTWRSSLRARGWTVL